MKRDSKMTSTSELKTLDEINYSAKSKILFYFVLPLIILSFSFFINFPISDKIQSLLKNKSALASCPINFKSIHFEFFLPKAVITDIKIPGNCLGEAREDVILNSVNIEWRLINFFPFGIPFKISTQLMSQNIDFFVIQTPATMHIRMIDQILDLKRIESILGNYKLSGQVTTNLNATFSNNKISDFDLKISSKNFSVPSQTLEDFKIPELKIEDFYLEAKSSSDKKINVEKLFLGSTTSPIRANFKGHLNISNQNIKFSPILLIGEVSFSTFLKSQIPLIDLLFQSFNQKDGFYQIKLGGTLGAPKPLPL